jgi:tetratricopeptide (TPR) repeat protein
MSTASVTICIPGYRSAAFIGQTLASLVAQTRDDFRVLLALEPDGATETVEVMRDFLRDPRFGYYVNDERLGYSANVREVLKRVDTPYYAILPHDDMWAAGHLEALLSRLEERPDATAAYGDMYFFNGIAGIRVFPIADAPLYERLLSFFLDKANGMPWHGVGRSDMLDWPHPTNEFGGFAVEAVWSMHLAVRGATLRVPGAAYLKRFMPRDSEAVSIGWLHLSEEAYRQAQESHRSAIFEVLASAKLPSAEMRILDLAAEMAMFDRWVLFSPIGKFDLGRREHERAERILAELDGDRSATALAIVSRVHESLGRYWLRRGRRDVGLQHAQLAAALDPGNGDAQILLANAYLTLERVTDALLPMRRGARLLPTHAQLGAMQQNVARQLAALGVPARSRAA